MAKRALISGLVVAVGFLGSCRDRQAESSGDGQIEPTAINSSDDSLKLAQTVGELDDAQIVSRGDGVYEGHPVSVVVYRESFGDIRSVRINGFEEGGFFYGATRPGETSPYLISKDSVEREGYNPKLLEDLFDQIPRE